MESTPLHVCENNEQSITNACTILNEKIHNCVKQQISSDAIKPHDITSLDVDVFIESVDPTLWRSVCLLTKPKTSKADNNSTRKMRRFFFACVCERVSRRFSNNNFCGQPGLYS